MSKQRLPVVRKKRGHAKLGPQGLSERKTEFLIEFVKADSLIREKIEALVASRGTRPDEEIARLVAANVELAIAYQRDGWQRRLRAVFPNTVPVDWHRVLVAFGWPEGGEMRSALDSRLVDAVPTLVSINGGPCGTLQAFLGANPALPPDEVGRLLALRAGETVELGTPPFEPYTVTRLPNQTIQIGTATAARVVESAPSVVRQLPGSMRMLGVHEKSCGEPLLIIAEADARDMYACGPCGCAHEDDKPKTKRARARAPMTVRMERFVPGEPTAISEYTLSPKLSKHVTKGGCIPELDWSHDPQAFREMFDRAKAGGPVWNAKILYERIRDQLSPMKQEVFVAVLLNTQLEAIGQTTIARGADDHVEAPIANVLRVPLMAGAASTIVVHNHPSGHPSPSSSDKELTLALAKAFEAADLHLNDHLIVGARDYYSFAEHGVL